MDKTPMKATVARIAAQTAMTRRVKKKLPPPISGAWKVVRGDKVEIVSGKEKGKRGTVLKIYRKEQRVLVEGLNLVKRHTPGQSSKLSGGLVHCVRELSLMWACATQRTRPAAL
jgi:transcription antitermination factor NusG